MMLTASIFMLTYKRVENILIPTLNKLTVPKFVMSGVVSPSTKNRTDVKITKIIIMGTIIALTFKMLFKPPTTITTTSTLKIMLKNGKA